MPKDELASNYYAFISYSRSDIRAAKFIQKGLENFNYTVFSIADEYKPQDSKYLRKVFRDRTDMGFNELDYRELLKKALDRSRYLIVICSPNARGSSPVQAEIEYF